jgi:hypothetical protein
VLLGTTCQAVSFTAIDLAIDTDALALRQVHTTIRAGNHLFGSDILSRRGICTSVRLTLGPQQPNHSQESKQKQVFHHLPRAQKKLTKNPQACIFTTLQYLGHYDPRKQKATPKDG